MSYSILVIDDEESILKSVKGALTDEGYQVITALDARTGIKIIKEKNPNVVLLDIWMEKMDGLQALEEIQQFNSKQTVIMMSGHGTIETAVKATKLGAYDFVEKPLSLEKLLVLLKNACRTQDLTVENDALRKRLEKNKLLVGSSSAIEGIKKMIQQVAPTTGSVLITGENGTGKEVVAQSIHAMSQRFNKPFVEVNCAAIPEQLIESELFGHERGSFTGATQMKRGKFDLANGGTIFLDEIGDMSLKTQAKVLRILQEQNFERVGGNQTIKVDVRVLAATNKEIKTEIREGRFRDDLFYRLNVIPFHIPPLRDRKDDVPELAEHFLCEFHRIHGKKKRDLTPGAKQVLNEYFWPGNVRELKNLIERITILTISELDGADIQAADLLHHLEIDSSGPPEEITDATLPSKNPKKLRHARQEFEREFILRTLKDQGGNISKTASILGIERSHLHKKIKAYGIEVNP